MIGECLHGIHQLGGEVVSVTTDGFITDVDNLEFKLSQGYLMSHYRCIRKDLSGDSSGLEVKSVGRGVMA